MYTFYSVASNVSNLHDFNHQNQDINIVPYY